MPVHARLLRPVLLVGLLLLLAPEAPAADLLLFEGGEAPAAPAQATVRRLPGAEVWIFSGAQEAREARAAAGAGRLLHVDGTAVLSGPGRHAASSGPDQAVELWSGGGFRLLALPPGAPSTGCEERLEPAPRAMVRQAAPLVVGSDPAEESALVAGVDQARYTRILSDLCGASSFELNGATRRIHTRSVLDTADPDGIGLARDYLLDRFAAAGYTPVRQDFTFLHNGMDIPASNVLAIHPGTTLADEVLVVGAHFDATARAEDPSLPAPGAEDNASGTAAVLHLAELLAGYETQRTIHFVCFDAEETGLHGSEHYVAQAVDSGLNVVGALTMDMISAWVSRFGITIEGQLPWQELMFALRDNVNQWTPMNSALSYYSYASDHVSFQNAGIPALLAIELDELQYTDYHRSTDTFDKVDPALGAQVARAMAGSIADIAGVARKVAISSPPPGAGPARPALALLPNRPNPFNPRTTLRYVLPAPGPARLEIVDLRGRHVRTVLDAWLDAGPHETPWDGRDDAGRAVASGLYFSRLVHPEGVRARSLSLVR